MVDSAVGGKTGINLPHGKNLIGAFHQPSLVVCDIGVLKTLPRRELVAGIAEVVKYGVIRDTQLFELLEKNAAELSGGEGGSAGTALLAEIVARSCAIKAEIVGKDEREEGLRAILNFGHTLGHALEAVAGYGHFLHGEAVAVGMVYAARLSVALHGMPPPDAARLEKLLARLGLPVAAKEFSWEALRHAMGVDKKGVMGKPKFVLARKIGEVDFGCDVPEDALLAAWNH
jgi:3-dehydroquinate synthase